MNYEQMAKELGVAKEAEELQILASGFKGIAIKDYILTPQAFPEKMPQIKKEWIERIWAGQFLFDGALASVSAFRVNQEGILEFVLQKTNYILYVGTRGNGLQKLNPTAIPLDQNQCLPLSFGATTLTTDDYIVLGVRSQKEDTSRGKAGSIPSGYLNPETVIYVEKLGNQISFEALILEELREELGITDYLSKKFLALIQYQQPLIAIRLKIPYAKAELERISKIGFEHSQLLFVKNDLEAIKQVFRNYQFSPHTLSTLICHCCM